MLGRSKYSKFGKSIGAKVWRAFLVTWGAGMDIAAWLDRLGLEIHAAAFAQNGIDAELLADLNNEDLKDLGIEKLADRKRLLHAIADLSSGSAATTTVRPSRAAKMTGEHRQVTVLFADIASFTKLTAELGAENIHALLNRFFETVDAVVASYGGTIDKHMGDNVMALFGAPVAHDDDPLRAVRAAFEIHRQVGELQDGNGQKLGVHVGIANGQVVASGTGSDSYREYTVTGASVNLAARLQAKAVAGETLISDALHRAVAHAIECESLGDCEVKGMDRPVAVWKVKSQQATIAPAARVFFVGRDAELAQLSGIIERCHQSGHGCAVVLRGEAGIGKTRLLEELTRLATTAGFKTHRGLVLDFGAGEGRDAIRAVVRSLLDIPVGSDGTVREAVATATINRGLLSPERRIFLCDLLDLPQSQEERAVYDAMTNATRNEGKRTVLAELLQALAAQQPLVVIIEDIHWADPLILAHLARIAATLADCRGLLVMTSRVDGYPLGPAWRSSTGGCPFVTLDLRPLRNEEAVKLAAAFTDADNQTALDCIARAGGNPLFLEQLLRNVKEHGDGDIPASIQSLVLARIDRLPAFDKQALQAASVLGQRFGLDAVRYLIGSAGYDCRLLIERSFVRPEGDNFLFDHALVQEAVFGSLLKNQRENLHRQAADFFAKTDLILHAQHLDRARDAAAPAAYLDAAIAQATALHFNTALTLAGRGLEIVTDPAITCSLACLRGEALRNTGATDKSIAAFELAVAAAVGPRQRCLALIGIAEGLRVADRHQQALDVLKDAEAVAFEADLLPELTRIHCLRGNVYFPLGRLTECRAANEKALELSRRAGSVEGEALALSGLGDAYYLAGQMRTAGEQFRACVELCQKHGLRRVEVANRHMIGWTRLHLLEFAEAEADGLAAVKLATEVGHPRAQLLGLQLAAYVNSELGEFEKSDDLLQQALGLAQSIHADNFTAQILRWLAWNAFRQGDRPGAKIYVSQAVQVVRRVGMTFVGPAVLAVAATMAEDKAEAQALLTEAENILDAGCVAHNHFWFAQIAIGHALRAGDWDRAEGYARRLEIYTQTEPLPWSNFLIAKGRALTAWAQGEKGATCRDELRRLRSVAMERHLRLDVVELNNALAAA